MTGGRLDSTLGQRIINTARMASWMHLSQLRLEESLATRQQVTGGAGDTSFTDGVLAASSLSAEHRVGDSSALAPTAERGQLP